MLQIYAPFSRVSSNFENIAFKRDINATHENNAKGQMLRTKEAAKAAHYTHKPIHIDTFDLYLWVGLIMFARQLSAQRSHAFLSAVGVKFIRRHEIDKGQRTNNAREDNENNGNSVSHVCMYECIHFVCM